MADLTFRRSLRFLRPFYARADVALAKSES
jgi:hypothetical protein